MDSAFLFLHYPDMLLSVPVWAKSIEVLQIGVYEHAAKWVWKREQADHFNLWLALEGDGVFEHEDKSWPFSSGSIFLFPPGMRPTGRATGGLRMINFSAHIRGDARAMALLASLAREASPARLRNFIWASHLCRYLCEAFYLRPLEGRELVLSGLGLLLQGMDYERSHPPGDAVDGALIQIVERIRRNPAAAYSVAEMAASVRLCGAQFSRRFRAITGLTPNRFIVEERLGRAESYLRETSMSVQEIAGRLGYRDVYFFSRQFRRFRGVCPTGVRRLAASRSGQSP